ncbi:hypothetical protein RHA1_ro08217 (plasmid) [Rhodococcus jostii RHA1]|jgi:hypothetical protein|uniref:Uncharacterized protein n=2 Tax=Rhodococcus TaxID=1827 RepID=Q0RZM4_RHOJR|nr:MULTISPECIES: hypothetical protein [Rhodococcus]ABG99262.1 hypothetical protein RHA1_ro08217 [Rhodococcus jostii RHA1]EID80161.1 hypothetical protein W59_09707 [Rhodococcus opacus RKJ300 = JCM 13270]QQZ18516.1 hypothetical protein GO592_40905 [Rhodococcus sp. 21391]
MTHDPDLGVLVRRVGSTSAWATPEMTAYVNEDHLQRIIADAPVEYLNEITRDDIRRDGDLEILIPSTYGGEIAAAKTRASAGTTTRWTKETFLDAIGSDTDHASAEKLFALLGQVDGRRGTHDDLWYGNKPGGGIVFHPYGLRYAPIQLWINKTGQLMAYGNWYQYVRQDQIPPWVRRTRPPRRPGHQSTEKGFPIADLPDLDQFWSVTLRCAEHINRPHAGSDHRDVDTDTAIL